MDTTRIPNNNHCVDSIGVIEIRFASDNPAYHEEPIDLFTLQKNAKQANLGFDEKFCQKDRTTTIQKYFFCVVCDCRVEGFVCLYQHVKGKKHSEKLLQRKRLAYALPQGQSHKLQTKSMNMSTRPLRLIGKYNLINAKFNCL